MIQTPQIRQTFYIINDLTNMEGNISQEGGYQTSHQNYNLENEHVRFVTEGHALMNVVVLDNIVRYLQYHDIRRFRLVCQRWNEVSANVIWKLSRIRAAVKACYPEIRMFQNMDLDDAAIRSADENNKKLIESFESMFPLPGMPSNEITFEGYINRAALDYLWKERGSLTLTKIYFRYFCEPRKMCIDLNNYMRPNVTTLDIRNSFGANLKVSLEILSNIQHLHLENCEILLNGKIVPTQLILHDSNSVSYKGTVYKCREYWRQNLQKVLLNDFVDFSKIKKLCLRGNIWKLDVGSGNRHLENLDINDVELVDMNNSQWTTNRLNMKGNICMGDKMEIKSISTNDNITVDVQSLPKNMECLSIAYFFQLVAPQILDYTKLKYVAITTNIKYDFPIFDFSRCGSLVDFHLRVDNGIYEMDFNRVILPNSIKKLKLHNVDITTDVPWELDILVLDKYSFSFAKCVLDHVKTSKLALEFDSALEHPEDQMSIVNLWKNSNIQQIAFGGIRWSGGSSVLNSEFLKTVDRIGSHYLFSNKHTGIGKAIDYSRFIRLCILNVQEKDLITRWQFG